MCLVSCSYEDFSFSVAFFHLYSTSYNNLYIFEKCIQIDKSGNPLVLLDENDNPISESFSTLEKRPYVEVGGGIENILNFIRIDAVYRLTYIDEEYKSIYKRGVNNFGLKLSFQFRL